MYLDGKGSPLGGDGCGPALRVDSGAFGRLHGS